jgi:hypothetical protein
MNNSEYRVEIRNCKYSTFFTEIYPTQHSFFVKFRVPRMQKIYRTVTAFEMRMKISVFIFHGGHVRRNMKKDLEPVSSKIHVKPVLSRIAIFRHSSTVFSFTEQRFCEYETDSRIRGKIIKYSDFSCLPNAPCIVCCVLCVLCVF